MAEIEPPERNARMAALSHLTLTSTPTGNFSSDDTDGLPEQGDQNGHVSVLFQPGLLRNVLHEPVHADGDEIDSPCSLQDGHKLFRAAVGDVTAKTSSMLEQLEKALVELEAKGQGEDEGAARTSLSRTTSACTCADQNRLSRLIARIPELESELQEVRTEMERKEEIWTRKETDWLMQDAVLAQVKDDKLQLEEKYARSQADVLELRREKKRAERLLDLMEEMARELRDEVATYRAMNTRT